MRNNILKFGLTLMVALIAFGTTVNAQCNSHHKRTSYKKHSKKRASNGEGNSIVSIAAGADNLSTLVAALKAADLVSTLEGGPFTVFAPTNEAFAALPKGTVENLLKPENKAKLVKVLTYHVVSGRVESTDLKDGQKVKSVEGDKIDISVNDTVIKIDDALVKSANIRATNGVVHLIDRVILPADL